MAFLGIKKNRQSLLHGLFAFTTFFFATEVPDQAFGRLPGKCGLQRLAGEITALGNRVLKPLAFKNIFSHAQTYTTIFNFLAVRFEVGDTWASTRNIRTGAQAAKVHHCPICKKEITKRCYDKLHWAWCEVPLKNGELCGERFQVVSPGGCMKPGHEYHNSDENIRLRNSRRELDGGGMRKKAPDAEDTIDKEELPPVEAPPAEPGPWLTYWEKPEFRKKPPPPAPPAPKTLGERKPKKMENTNTYGSFVERIKNKVKAKKNAAN
ncbi:uncharacterized protein BDZ99DRAFT_473659 [Mytilinidion resinicola]|uniref:Uncharacterized protein n=1 Tax=Mytilinidion resinicola TaxID=574789 RepID=A0A6A6YYA3_9PEZI|nr:uncharacterized protein BDZ99DRAFT_473659 [Mytilinidion resinicola]KAF2812905.1 hypothetical protein BDZ99DRAFT_473659 [Mytilinidion resinicola]